MPSLPSALVTGGAGFIGSHMVKRLLSAGHKVPVLDNFSTGRPQNLLHLQPNPNLQIHEVDIADLEAIRPLFQAVDWVFHMAALADIVPSIQHPVAYYQSNVTGTLSVLEAAHGPPWQR